ncbi:MAG TPA: glycosyltransferase [Nitrolancea sp.]|nr:glycosyltransferase [Nitrolancea sp.]
MGEISAAPARRLSSLRVRGPFRGPSGYDHHVREFTRELVHQGVAVQLIDLPSWSPVKLPPSMRDPWFEELERPLDAEITLHFTMPHQVKIDRSTLNVNYTSFESTRVPESWIECNLRHDMVIVTTESSRQAWLNSGMPDERLRVVPLGINPRLYGQAVEPLTFRTQAGRPVLDYTTRFLNVSELGPRKNIVGLLHAWLDATRDDDDAILILKLGRYTPGWFELMLLQMRQLEDSTGRRFADAAPVEMLLDLLPDAEMPRLFAVGTHYISLSHGEGWDQPMVEAAASGLRLIAPDHSAYQAYLTPETATLLPSREVPARFEGDPGLQALFEGSNWWEPDHEAAVAAIRAAIARPTAGPYGARDVVLRDFTWERATSSLVDVLDELLAK